IATFALLHESIAALASERASLPKRNPDVNRMRLLRPGTSVRFWAMLRKASSMLRAPYAPMPLPRRGTPMLATCGPGAIPVDLMPPTTCFSRSMSPVKFCAICSELVKFTIAISRAGPALDSMKRAAAWRACTCSPIAMVELSKNRTMYRFCPPGPFGSAPEEKVLSCCSLLSSQTLKFFSSRSSIYAPFLPVTTTSTSTSLVSVRITGGALCGCACWAGARAPARRRTPLNSIVRWNRMLHPLVRNLDGAVLRRHQLSFDIPDHQPDRITARLYIETGADGQASAQSLFHRLVKQPHLDFLLIAGHIHTVAVQQARHHRQFVAVAVLFLAELETLDVHLDDQRNPRRILARLEELGMQFHRDIAHLLAREQRLFDFALRGLDGILQMLRRIVARARPDADILHGLERYLQRVETAVHFEVLRGEGQQVIVFRSGHQTREPGVQIVVVLEEGGARARRQFRHHIGLRAVGLALHLMQDHFRNIVGALASDIGSVRIETAGIQRVDQHASANRAVHDFGLFNGVLRQGHKPARDQDH